MVEQPNEVARIATIAADLGFSAEMRIKAIELLGKMGTRDALLALLELAANEKLFTEERDLSIRQAREIIRSGR
ncbi:hypothetical protein ACFLT0_00265 [Chloroflexota bacterium]